MQANMSLGQFRLEIGAYNRFQLLFDDPLSPISFSTQFDHASVILSASPYLALKNSNDCLCLSHIQAIKKRGRTEGYQSYIFLCNDFSFSNDPTPMKFILNCA